MNYSASLSDFFKSPKWGTNLLLGGVCMLIPVVGPLALMGWHAGALYGRKDKDDFLGYPEFNFSNLGTYIERGVWPFLVQMVVSLVLVPVMWVVMAVPMFSMVALMAVSEGKSGQAVEPSPLMAIGMALVMAAAIAVGVAIMVLISKPMMLRATLEQGFGPAFDFGFIKRFIALTWKEQIISVIYLMAVSIMLGLLGMMVFCVGIYFVAALITFMTYHLDRQLYDLYLARGGEPVAVSPKLSDAPPPVLVG